MKKVNVGYEKSYEFAIRTMKAYQYLTKDKKEFLSSKQPESRLQKMIIVNWSLVIGEYRVNKLSENCAQEYRKNQDFYYH